MTNAIIIEDEALAARRLKKLVEANDIPVLVVCKSIKETIKYLDNNKEPDLYFMDIHINDGIIFELLSNIKLSSPIIFTTAYDQYAVKAFKQNSVDYLLKPIDESELSSAINKYRSQKKENTSTLDLQTISQLILSQQQNVSYKKRFKVKVGDYLRIIDSENIVMFYSDQKINFLLNENARKYPVDYNLGEIIDKLSPQQYYKVNRSQIINISFIKEVLSFSNSRLKVILKLEAHPEIIVAREKVKLFKDWLG